MRKRQWQRTALGIGCLVLASCSSDGDSSSTVATEPATSVTVESTTTSSSPTTSAPTTAPATTSSPTTTTPPSTTTTVAGAVPGRVSGVHAYPGGGSGEVAVSWNAVTNATGYRIYRADSPDGEFVRVGRINVVTGSTSAVAEVVNIWSVQHSYVPSGGALASPDTSATFEYVELSAAGERCFKVVAFNDAGRGHSSTISCSGPV